MIKKLLDKWTAIPVQARATSAYTVCSILQKCLSFITLPLFTRLLTTEQFGQYNVYTSWSSILTIFLTLYLGYGSFSTAMVKFEDDRRGYVCGVQGVCCALTLLFLALYLPLRNFWNGWLELPTPLVLLMAVEILTSFAITCYYEMNRFEYRYKSVVTLTLLNTVVSPALALILVLNSQERGYARIIGYALGNVIIGLSLFIFNTVKGGGKNTFSKKYWKYALSFNIPLIPYYLSQVIFNQSDRIMISHISGTDKAGLYGVAYNLAMLLNFVLNAINNAYIPWFYGKIKEGKAEDNKPIANGIAILMAFLLLAVIALAPEIVLILAGEPYRDAMWVVPPVAMSLLLLFYAQLFINVEFYYEEKAMLVWGSIVSAVLNVVLNALLIPIFGFVAAGYTTLLSYMVFALANYIVLQIIAKRRGQRMDYFDLRSLLLILAVFMGLSFLALALYELIVIRYCIVAAVLLSLIVFHKKVIAFVKAVLVRK